MDEMDEQEMLMLAQAKKRAAAAAGPDRGILDASSEGIGASIPFSDEILATAGAPFRAIARKVKAGDWAAPSMSDYGDAYNTEHKRLLQHRDDAQKNHPGVYGASEIVGGVALMPTKAAAAPTWGKRAWQTAKEGAAYTGAYAAGEGEGLLDRAEKGAVGTVAGGLVGGAASPILEVGAKGYQNVVKPAMRWAFQPEKEAGIRAGLALEKNREATAGLDLDLPDRGVTDKEFTAGIDDGVPLKNVERAGEAGRSLLESAAQTSPKAMSYTKGVLNPRHGETYDRTHELLDNISPYRTEELRDGLKQRAKEMNANNYDAAWNHPDAQAMWDEKFQQLYGSNSFRKAMKDAVGSATDAEVARGAPAIRHPFGVDESDNLILKDEGIIPNLAYWNEVKEKLDDQVSSLLNKGEKKAAMRVTAIKNDMLSHLDSKVPEYATARAGAAAHIGAEDALDAGFKLVTDKNVTKEQAFRMYNDMNPAERELTKIGIVNGIKHRIGSGGRDIPGKLLGDRNTQARLGYFLGDETVGRLHQRLGFENAMTASKNQATGGSQTYGRLAKSAMLGAAGGGLYEGAGPDTPFHWGSLSVTGLTALGGHKGQERMAMAIARKLLSDDPAVIRSASKYLKNNPRILGTVNKLMQTLQVGGTQAWYED